MAPVDPRAWRSGQRPKPVPKMSHEEIAADYARREAEQQAEQARQQAELEAEFARHKAELEADAARSAAGISPPEPPSETTIEDFTETEF